MFRVYRDDQGRWCACRDDGLVGGIFCDRAEAERFVRSEEQLAQGPSRSVGVAEVTRASPAAMETPPQAVQASSSRSSVRFVDFRSQPLLRQG